MNEKRPFTYTGIFTSRLRERGNALVMLAIAIPVLLAAAGLALDWGRGVWVKTNLQKAADAGALAGAAALPYSDDAMRDAEEIVNINFPNPDKKVFNPLGGYFDVDLAENVPTFFMRLFGHATMDVVVHSRAIVKRPVGGLRGGAFPFAIINPDLNDDPTDDLVPSNYGRPYIIMYGEDNVMVPDWANGSAHVPDPPAGNSRGWRGALGLCQDGTTSDLAGADDIVYAMLNGWPGWAMIGDELATKTGNMDQSLARARDNLLGDNPLPWSEFDPERDANDPRVVMVPIVHLVNYTRRDTYTMQDYYNSAPWEHSYIVIDGFAPFFVLTVDEQGDVDGDGATGDRDWIVGYFVPGVETRNFMPAVPGTPNYGLFSPPRLVE
jgi:hypothetical protein